MELSLITEGYYNGLASLGSSVKRMGVDPGDTRFSDIVEDGVCDSCLPDSEACPYMIGGDIDGGRVEERGWVFSQWLN